MNQKLTFLTDQPTVTVEQVVGWEYALDAARFTQGKPMTHKKPSEAFIKKALTNQTSAVSCYYTQSQAVGWSSPSSTRTYVAIHM